MYYAKDMGRRRPGVLFGVGLEGIFLTRFIIEFIKIEQVDFEKGMMLDMGQILSIPFIVLGIYMIYRGFAKPAKEVVTVQAAANPDTKHKSHKKKTAKW